MADKAIVQRATDGTDISLRVHDNGDGTFSAAVYSGTGSTGSLTDRSGTITAGGTAQTAAAANTSRKYLRLRNPTSATEPLWFRLTGTAAAASPSTRLDPGDEMVWEGSFIPSNALSVFAATTAHGFTAEEG